MLLDDDTLGGILYIKILTRSTKAFNIYIYNYMAHLARTCVKVLN